MNLPDTVVLNKQKIKVLTPNGYENFLGVNKIVENQYIHLKFEDNNELKCSLDHPILTINGIVKAKDLDKKTEVVTKEGGTFVKSYKIIKKQIELYDIVNSGTDHLYYSNNIASHNCEFLGSVDTLISGSKLSNLIQEAPIKSNAGLDIYENPISDHQYIMTVDVARGVEIDYSAFVIIDITQLPYKVVGKYKNNTIKPIVFPYIIHESAKAYNNAHILCEVNDVGDQVAAGLHYDLEYPNVLMCSMRGRAGQVLGQGFSGSKVQLGLKMSKNTKKVGCFNLKAMIEEEKLIISDYDIISELSTFVQKYNTFSAEEGSNDDLVMCIHKDTKILTEIGLKPIKWIVDKKYNGKVLSIDKNNNLVWNKVIGRSVRPNKNKKWIKLSDTLNNNLICTTDHKIAHIKDPTNAIIEYIEAENMLGKYNVSITNNNLNYHPSKIVEINDIETDSDLYDITVENTHNFVADGMIVHNCLVIFSWLVCQDYYKEMTDTNIRSKLYEEKQNQMEQDMSPFGFVIDGNETEDDITIEGEFSDNDKWMAISKDNLGKNPSIVDIPIDEYGNMQYMWDYM